LLYSSSTIFNLAWYNKKELNAFNISSMTDSQTSSATKLAQILQDAFKLRNSMASDVWKQVLKFDPDRDGILENKYLIMLQLFQHVRYDLNLLSVAGIKTEKYSKAIDRILSVLFNLSINITWQEVINKIAISNIELLESCGETLIARGEGLKDISEIEVENLLSSIISFVSEIEELDIDDNTKQVLIQKLHKIKRSLEDYEVFGPVIFQKIVDESFIETVIFDRNQDKSKWNKDGIEKVKNLVDFIFKLTTICTTLEKTCPQIKPLVENFIHMLPPSG
jgi:hypothetical protein